MVAAVSQDPRTSVPGPEYLLVLALSLVQITYSSCSVPGPDYLCLKMRLPVVTALSRVGILYLSLRDFILLFL